jgi:Zn-dependent peptidase ImmA (M78 family)
MVMDEFDAVLKARELVKRVNPTAIPVSVELYTTEFGAVIRPQKDLGADEPGWSFENNGKYYICTNSNDRPERQRFTVCHELAHRVLGLPSEHGQSTWWSYAKRPWAEILCDVFAAELLLPSGLFKPEVEKVAISLRSIDDLAGRFEASVMATGSRYAAVVSTPLAFVLSEKGKIRYASRSTSLREAGAWIQPSLELPRDTLSEKARAGGRCDGPSEIDADVWFKEWERGGTLLEEVRHLSAWDQTLTLLWFEDEEVPPPKSRDGRSDDEENDGLLKELDGNLRWPDKRRRS